MHFVARQRVDGRTLVVTFRLDTGTRRIKPAEIASARQAIHELRKEDFRIAIANTAWMLTDKHQYRDAIAEANRMIRLHPREALHHLSATGADPDRDGSRRAAARREAQQASSSSPRNADGYVVLRVGARARYARALSVWLRPIALAPALHYEQARKQNSEASSAAAAELVAPLERDLTRQAILNGAPISAGADGCVARCVCARPEQQRFTQQALILVPCCGPGDIWVRPNGAGAVGYGLRVPDDALLVAAIRGGSRVAARPRSRP